MAARTADGTGDRTDQVTPPSASGRLRGFASPNDLAVNHRIVTRPNRRGATERTLTRPDFVEYDRHAASVPVVRRVRDERVNGRVTPATNRLEYYRDPNNWGVLYWDDKQVWVHETAGVPLTARVPGRFTPMMIKALGAMVS